MIGQEKLKSQIKELIQNNSFPQTYIIAGNKGQGKKTLAHYISSQLNYVDYIIDHKIDSIRNLIVDANTVTVKTHYTIYDLDEGVVEAQNSILKLIEEPPVNAIFCITCKSEYNVLPTIKSRSIIFKLQPYSNKELNEFCELNNISINTDICDTMQDILLLNKYDYNRFNEFVDKLYNNIKTVSYGALKAIQSNFALQGEKQLYDLSLFFKLFIKYSLQHKNLPYTRITNQYLNEISSSNNLTMLFTNWFIDIKEVS